MASSDHSQFQFAAERYVLDELSEPEKLAFEEHYFACGSCAQSVEDLQQIRAALPAALPRFIRESGTEKSRGQSALPFQLPWFQLPWFQLPWVPQAVLATIAVLVIMVSYQNAVQIPRLRETSASLLLTGEPIPLPATRSAGSVSVSPENPSASFLIPNEWADGYTSYRAQLSRSGSGRILAQGSTRQAKGALVVSVPVKRFGVGRYQVSILGETAGGPGKIVAIRAFGIDQPVTSKQNGQETNGQ